MIEYLHDHEAALLAEQHIQAKEGTMDKCRCETRRGICPGCTAWFDYTMYCWAHVPQDMEPGQPTATECLDCEADRDAPEEEPAPPSTFVPW